jgi:O-antigen/teichoic acid export membrane protein
MNAAALVWCIVGVLVFLTVNTTIVTALNLLGRRILYVIYSGATSWIGLAFSALLTLGINRNAELWITGQIAGWMIISGMGIVRLRQSVATISTQSRDESSISQGLWAFAWPLVISTSLYWFQVQGYRIELDHAVSISAVGLLTIGLLLGANPVTIIDTLLGDYLRPQYYAAIAGNNQSVQETAWSTMAVAFLSSLIPVTVLVGFSGRFLAVLLVGPSFKSISGLIVWGVLIEFLRAVYSLYVLAAHTRFQTRTMLRPAIVGAAVVLLSIVPLAHWNLYIGTGLSLVLSMAGSTAYLALNLRTVFKARIPWPKVIKALACSSPIGVGLLGAQSLIKQPSSSQAIAVLALACLVTLGIQAYLWRTWLPSSTKAVQKLP